MEILETILSPFALICMYWFRFSSVVDRDLWDRDGDLFLHCIAVQWYVML